MDTTHVLYSDLELKIMITKLTDKIRETKEKNNKLTEEQKELLHRQKKVSDSYNKLINKKRSMTNKIIAIRNNVHPNEYFKKENALDKEYVAIKKKHEDYQQIMINKEIKQIDKVLEKESM
jgi:FtsZ-binding cell division protein ZapB